jgi:hypothetical protein
MSAVDVSVVVLTMYSIEITMYSAMAVYMIVSVVRNHLAHRPIRWLLLSLAVLFAARSQTSLSGRTRASCAS